MLVACKLLLCLLTAKAINSFLIVGDYGHTSRSGAERIAAQMNNWAGANGADFILSLGDNFYQDGPSSVSDALFNTRWADVYTGSNIAVNIVMCCWLSG